MFRSPLILVSPWAEASHLPDHNLRNPRNCAEYAGPCKFQSLDILDTMYTENVGA
jgi:hypothetical protein